VKTKIYVILRASLKDVARIAKLTAENIVSVGASLAHVHVPGRAADDSTEDAVKGGETEVGMGIHNEPGSERVKTDLVGLVKKMLAQLLDQSDKDRAFLEISKNDKIVLLINNLGGVSVLELGGITAEVSKQLTESYSIKPVRLLAGTFMTSLNGMGFSISLLKLVDTKLGGGKSLLELFDAPAEAVGWTAAIAPSTWDVKSETVSDLKAEEEELATGNIKSKDSVLLSRMA
jgi:dihydroxyacetone kinase